MPRESVETPVNASPAGCSGDSNGGKREAIKQATCPQTVRRGGDDVLETRFGAVPLDADRQIWFRGGLPGFPAVELFQLDPIPGIEGDLLILQAVDAPGIGFITLPLPDDIPLLRQNDLLAVSTMLDIARGDLMVLAIVTLAAGDAGIEKFLNLRAPLFIDVRRKLGAQVVLGDASYPLRFRLASPGTLATGG